MKSKYHYEKVKKVFKSEGFLIVYIGILLLNIISLITNIGESYFESLLLVAGDYYNYILFCILAFSGFTVSKIYSKNFEMILRYKSKKEYLDNLVKINSIVTAVIILLSFMISIILFTLNYLGEYEIITYNSYQMNILSYYIFFIVRYIIIACLISNIFMLLYKNIGVTITSLLVVFFLFLMYGPVYKAAIVESFKDVTLLPGYFLSIKAYSNFGLEVSASLLMILILLIINVLLYNITIKRKNNNFLIS